MTYNFECDVCNGERYRIVPSAWDDDLPMRVECDECRVNSMLLTNMSYQLTKLLTNASIESLAAMISVAFVERNCNDMDVLNRVENMIQTKDHKSALSVMGAYLS
tara:strand:+ start:366 stop:680 length:315 start_codon:yes stop_codon:yes gene_type:complete